MMVIERNCDYSQLREKLCGKKVLICRCGTCASLCNGIGSEASADTLSQKLQSDGITVTGIMSTSAACIMKKVRKLSGNIENNDADIILALTCNVGAENIRKIMGTDVINPIDTLGPGYLDEEGKPHLSDGSEPSDMSSPFC